MTTTLFKSGLLALTICCIGSLSAQNAPKKAGYYTFGINGGLAYQQADVTPRVFNGYGLGLTLAKNLYYRPGAPVSFDLRGRALYTRTYGLDSKPSYGILNNTAVNGADRGFGISPDYTKKDASGFVFSNYRTTLGELGLEGVVTLNSLREKTGWVVSLYGGLNLDWYKAQTDQSNSNGSYSDAYKAILSNSGSRVSQLKNTLDGTYETVADGFDTRYGKLGVMPSLGAEAGYELLPGFIASIGHKVNFSGTDALDGQRWNNNNTLTGNNDLHHYTYLQLAWEFEPGPRKMQPPLIEIIEPEGNPHVTSQGYATVKALVKNVNSQADISFSLNGSPLGFEYNTGSKRLNRTVALQKGSNEVHITATNPAGRDEKHLLIIYRDEIRPPDPVIPAPVVRFTWPAANPYTTEDEEITIRATVLHANARDIRLLVNGEDQRFRFSGNELNASLRLRDRYNNVSITANNSSGTTTESTAIQLERRETPPSVRFTFPQYSPFETDNPNETVRASVRGARSAADLVFRINGRNSTDFSFDPRSGEFSAFVRLREGRNDLNLAASNRAGYNTDQAVLILRRRIEPPVMQPPVVRIQQVSEPTENAAGNGCKSTITASIQFVDNRSAISFYVNGRPADNFDFDRRNGRFSGTANLEPGNNEVHIKAVNPAGSDEDRASVQCRVRPPMPRPVVNILQPVEAVSNTNNPNATVRASIQHVDNRNGIFVFHNGRRINDFDYNPATRILQAAIGLKDGSNNIRVRGENTSGADEKSVEIRYLQTPTPQKPVVKILSPENNTTTTLPYADLEARVVNVGSGDRIEVSVNDKNIRDFTYNKMRKTVTTRVELRQGDNILRVRAQNEAGSDEAAVMVKRTLPLERPRVSIVSPTDNSETESTNTQLKARVENVDRKEKINVYLNDQPIAFDFDNGTVSAGCSLKAGNNTLRVSAANDAGSDEQTARVVLKELARPQIRFTSPASAGSTVQSLQFNLAAVVSNVNSSDDIQLTVNGRQLTNFRYNSRNGTVSVNVTLLEGNNTFFIQAVNRAGTATAESSVIYEAPQAGKAPVVTLVSVSQPILSPMNPNVAQSRVIAKIQNVVMKNQISLQVNGIVITDFSFSPRSGNFECLFGLKPGENSIVLTATNESGSDEKRSVVKF